nr:hypothetical protein [Gammaproteobacteria bacterium]
NWGNINDVFEPGWERNAAVEFNNSIYPKDPKLPNEGNLMQRYQAAPSRSRERWHQENASTGSDNKNFYQKVGGKIWGDVSSPFKALWNDPLGVLKSASIATNPLDPFMSLADLVTQGTINTGQEFRNGDTVTRTAMIIEFGGAVAGNAIGGTLRFFRNQNIGQNGAMLDLAIDDSLRNIAASNIRKARNILIDAGLSPSQRRQIIKSFDAETFRVETVSSFRQEYRIFDDSKAKLEGRYVSPNFTANQTDRIIQFALPQNSATRLGVVDIPEGSNVFTGRIAQQLKLNPGLRGGEMQTFLLGPLDQFKFNEIMVPKNIINLGY